MFPWSSEFRWDVGHALFLGAFYAVLATMVAALVLSVRRARAGLASDRAAHLAWRAAFEELSGMARACRHQLTGEIPHRQCENGFDCRACAAHSALLARGVGPAVSEIPQSQVAGVSCEHDRLYHRGHTWVKPEGDGTVTVGLDSLAQRMAGGAAQVSLPEDGERLVTGGPLAFLRVAGGAVRVLSPVDGLVLGRSAEGLRFTLRIRPSGHLDLRHLLSGWEARVWLLREFERLQLALAAKGCGPALADGGELVADLSQALSKRGHLDLLEQMLLDC